MILAVLPVVCFGLSLAYLGATNPWRIAFMKAAVVWGLLVGANTEVLSLFGALSISWLSAAWALECCVAAFGLWWRRVELAERWRLPSLRRLSHVSLVAVAPVVIIVVLMATAPSASSSALALHSLNPSATSPRPISWVDHRDPNGRLRPARVFEQVGGKRM